MTKLQAIVTAETNSEFDAPISSSRRQAQDHNSLAEEGKAS